MDPDLLIVPCRGEIQGTEQERSCHHIYVVPFSEIGRIGCRELRPKIVVDSSLFGYELCVVGSRIYMFDSASKPGSAVGSFDLRKLLLDDDDTFFLREEMMLHMAPMCDQKTGFRALRAVPTPGGKILAFSTRIQRWSNRRMAVDFELYDPQTNSWEEIPPIQQANWDLLAPRSFVISSFAFLDDVTFAVDTDLGSQFRLTVGGPHGSTCWEAQQHHWLGGAIPRCGFSRAIGGGDQLWLTPSLVFDRNVVGAGKNHVSVCQFPMSAGFQFYEDFECRDRSQSIVFEETSSCCLLLETAENGLSGNHFLQIDAYHLDMDKYFQEKVDLVVGQANRRWGAPQLEYRLVNSTLFLLSQENSLSLPRLAKPPTITRK